jgi:hypothetical protein
MRGNSDSGIEERNYGEPQGNAEIRSVPAPRPEMISIAAPTAKKSLEDWKSFACAAHDDCGSNVKTLRRPDPVFKLIRSSSHEKRPRVCALGLFDIP